MTELSLVLHGLALALTLLLAWGLVKAAGRPRRRSILFVVVLALLGGGMARHTDPSESPTVAEIEVLHEGGTQQNIEQLYGVGVHAGPFFKSLRFVVSGDEAPDLRQVVRMNRIFAIVAGALAGAALFLVSGSFVLAALLTWAYSHGMSSVHLAASELPAALFALQFWMGALAAYGLHRALSARKGRVGCPRWLGLAALLLLGLVTGLVAGTRPELAGFGVAALLVAGLRLVAGDARLAAVDRLPRRIWDELRTRWAVVGGVILSAGLLLSALLWTHHVGSAQAKWVLAGLNPLNLSIFQLPFLLATLFQPGIVVLFVLGIIHGFRRWRSTMGLPVALVGLWGIYATASHGVFLEAFRYLLPLTPVVLLFTALGWREIQVWADRRGWGFGWERPVFLLLGLLLLAPPMHGRATMFGVENDEAPTYRTAVLMDLDIQREVRTLLEHRDAYPDCLFVAPVSRSRDGAQRGRALHLVLFHPSWAEPQPLPGDDGLSDALTRSDEHDCVLLYLGLDCNLTDADGCRRFQEPGADLLHELVFAAAPYSDVGEYGRTLSEVRLQLFAIRGP